MARGHPERAVREALAKAEEHVKKRELIAAIKAVREVLPHMGLSDAKDAVQSFGMHKSWPAALIRLLENPPPPPRELPAPQAGKSPLEAEDDDDDDEDEDDEDEDDEDDEDEDDEDEDDEHDEGEDEDQGQPRVPALAREDDRRQERASGLARLEQLAGERRGSPLVSQARPPPAAPPPPASALIPVFTARAAQRPRAILTGDSSDTSPVALAAPAQQPPERAPARPPPVLDARIAAEVAAVVTRYLGRPVSAHLVIPADRGVLHGHLIVLPESIHFVRDALGDRVLHCDFSLADVTTTAVELGLRGKTMLVIRSRLARDSFVIPRAEDAERARQVVESLRASRATVTPA